MAKTWVVALLGPIEQTSQQVGVKHEHMVAAIVSVIVLRGERSDTITNV